MSAFDDLTAGLTNVPDWWTLYDAWHRSFYKRATNYPTTEDAFTEGFELGKKEGKDEIIERFKENSSRYFENDPIDGIDSLVKYIRRFYT